MGAAAPAAVAAFVYGGQQIASSRPSLISYAQELEATPPCDDNPNATPPEEEGPFFKPSSPERSSLLEGGTAGTRLVISGAVLSRQCQPHANALLDFWQADDSGNYDNRGFSLRGHQYTDAQGRFTLETIVPGLYPGRTRHIHVKLQVAGGPILTTQIYFSGEARNRTDRLYNPSLEISVQDVADGKLGGFNFVVDGPST